MGVAGRHQQHAREQAARRVTDLACNRRAAHAEQSGSPHGCQFTVAARLPGPGRYLHWGECYLVRYMTQRNVTAPARPCKPRLEGNLGNDVLPSPAMTTQPGWEPRPGPTRGEPARRVPRGAAGGWPDDPARRRGGRGPPGPGRPDPRGRDPRGRDPRNAPGWAGPDDRGRGGGPRPPREPRQRPGDGPSGGSGRSPLRWIGAMSTRNGLLVLVAATVIGIVGTLVAGQRAGAAAQPVHHRRGGGGDAGGPARRGLPVLPAAGLRLLRGGGDNREDP